MNNRKARALLRMQHYTSNRTQVMWRADRSKWLPLKTRNKYFVYGDIFK